MMMGKNHPTLSRKNFLHLVGLTGLAGALPHQLFQLTAEPAVWPVLNFRQLPQQMQTILPLVPRLAVDPAGYLTASSRGSALTQRLPLAQTQWNLDHANVWDRLDGSSPWGIVLHWYGDDPGFDRTEEGYLRGFNTPRQVADYITQTSAHALVGGASPFTQPAGKEAPIAILQTQAPARDGTPLIASHLQDLDYQAHQNYLQYFVRAFYELAYKQPSIHSILQDWFDGSKLDANTRTLAIEQVGRDFDKPGNCPPDQQIANALGVIWAFMRRYAIQASSLLGHDEIQLDKPDPGKRFMARMRCLLAAKALCEDDPVMDLLVFGQHLSPDIDAMEAVRIYLGWVRGYTALVSRPSQVYTWESESGYWFLNDLVSSTRTPVATKYYHPLPGAAVNPDMSFGVPGNHAGVDLYIQGRSLPAEAEVRLLTDGRCLYTGVSRGFHPGKLAIFLHRQEDGAEIISIYENLANLNGLEDGALYPPGYPIGAVGSIRTGTEVLHFAIAYRTTWEKYLSANPDIAYTAGLGWVRENYLDPLVFMKLHPTTA